MMSGGSWDYVYCRVQDAADRLVNEKCPYRRALGKKLSLMAAALHEIEWVDSHDRSAGSETESIRAALGEDCDELALAQLVADAKRIRDELADHMVAIDRRREGGG